MAMAVVNRFIRNFAKYLESNEEIQELFERYKVAAGIDNALQKRYINKMDKGGDGLTPGLVVLRVPTIGTVHEMVAICRRNACTNK